MDNFGLPNQDDLSQAADGLADGLTEQVDAAASGLEQLGSIGDTSNLTDIAGQALDSGIDGINSAIDNLTSGLDDFLSKF